MQALQSKVYLVKFFHMPDNHPIATALHRCLQLLYIDFSFIEFIDQSTHYFAYAFLISENQHKSDCNRLIQFNFSGIRDDINLNCYLFLILIAVKHHVNCRVQLTRFSCSLPQYWARVYGKYNLKFYSTIKNRFII